MYECMYDVHMYTLVCMYVRMYVQVRIRIDVFAAT
jgi:hypothetical protein